MVLITIEEVETNGALKGVSFSGGKLRDKKATQVAFMHTHTHAHKGHFFLLSSSLLSVTTAAALLYKRSELIKHIKLCTYYAAKAHEE